MGTRPSGLHFVTGVPSKNALFGVSVIFGLCEHVYGAARYVHIQTGAALKEALAAGAEDEAALVVFVEAPDPEAVEILEDAADTLVVFDDDFMPATHFFMAEHGRDFRSAVRYASACLSIMPLFDRVDRALRLRPPLENLTFRTFLGRLADFYGLAGAGAVAPEIARRVGADEGLVDAPLIKSLEARFPVTREPVIQALAMTAQEERVLHDLASAYDGLTSTATPTGAVEWPVDFLLSGDRPDAYLDPTIELCGPARLLGYGPYLHLPLGAWVLEVILEVSDNWSGNEGEVSVLEEGKERGRATFPLEPSGRYQIGIPFVVESPKSPLEIYIRTNEGAIEGVITIETIRIVKGVTEGAE